MFDLLLWAFQIDKHGIVMTKGYFILRIYAFVLHTPEMILNTDYFMLLFIKMFNVKYHFLKSDILEGCGNLNIIFPNDDIS